MINADDMQSWAYLLAPTFQFVNTAGKPLTEGWLEVYIAGTRNKYYCASDFNGTLHPFQIPLDSLGANIVLADPSQAYDVYAYNKFGSLIMSRYHVTPVGAGGSSSVLNIVISSEDGTVTVNSDGNGNFDLSIKDTVDRVSELEDIVGNIETNVAPAYAIGHADTVNPDHTINLINDAVTGIDYLQDMTGYRLKSGHVYQFNFNAKFDCGENNQYCDGKFYIEGDSSIAQEWKFTLDDSYEHSESVNGSTVLVTPSNLEYYDIKLKYAWNEDYTNKPDIDLNKISIVDVTSIILGKEIDSEYTAGSGILIDEDNVISVDMDYINSHLDIDATEIIASAVNIATAYTNTVSGNIINYVDSVSGNLVDIIETATGNIPEQVQSNWTETDTTDPSYIQNKPDELELVAGQNIGIFFDSNTVTIAASATDLSDYATHSEVSAVSGNLVNYVNNVSGDIVNYVDSASGNIVNYVDESIVSAISVATGAQVQSDWTETDNTDPSYIQNKPTENNLVAGDNISITVSGTDVIISASGSSGVDNTFMATYGVTTFNEISTAKSEGKEVYCAYNDGRGRIFYAQLASDGYGSITFSTTYNNSVYYYVVTAGDAWSTSSTSIPNSQVQSNWTETNTSSVSYIQNKPDLSVYTTSAQVSAMIDSACDTKFVAELYTTPYDEILSAYNEGKTIVLSPVSGSLLSYDELNNQFTFAEETYISDDLEEGIGHTSFQYYFVDNNNDWTQNETISNVQADWNQVYSSSPDYIKNKPDLSVYTTQVQVSAIASAYASGGGGSGVNYEAGDHIDITDNTISVTGITELVAGNAITITASGASAIISSTGEAQVQSDWNVTDSSSKAYIRNKPSIPAAQIQSDWNQTNTSSKDYIKNKPIIKNYTGASGVVVEDTTITLDEPLGIVAGSGINIVIEGDSAIICVSGVTGGGTQVNADWTATSGVAEILNKPTESNLLPGSGITIAASGSDYVINTTPIQLVTALPANPVSGILYLIPEA